MMNEEHYLLKYFEYDHLPEGLALTSSYFKGTAQDLDRNLPDGSEKTVALRKLLESKDAAVRSKLDSKEND